MDDWHTLAFIDSSGREFATRFHHDAYYAEKVVIGRGDTIYFAVGREPRAGLDYVLRIVDGKVIDSMPSPLRTLRGVRSDGSLMYWNVSSRTPKGQSPEEIRSPDGYITIVSAPAAGFTLSAEIRVTLETQFGQPLPWSKFARSAESGGSVWISPTSEAQLVRVAESGLPDLRLQWETTDSTISASELAGLRNELAKDIPTSDTALRKQRQETIDRLAQGSRANAIDRIIGGRDGSIWVRNRRPLYGASDPHVFWVGFRQNGDLIGTLRLPFDAYVYELTETEALLERRTPFALYRVPLIRDTTMK